MRERRGEGGRGREDEKGARGRGDEIKERVRSAAVFEWDALVSPPLSSQTLCTQLIIF
jgi:hypothetical protein